MNDSIWQVPAYLPYLQPTLTDDAIASAEKELGFRLPSEFLALLREQNGGYTRYTLPGSGNGCIAGIGPNFPSLTDFDWDDVQEQVSFPLHGLVPFDGDGHWHLCLDYRENKNVPAVTYVDLECDESEVIAATFSAFLSMLAIDCEGVHVIESALDIGELVATIGAALNVTFTPPDHATDPNAAYHANLGTADSPSSLWISPNMVERGFAYADEAGYHDLKALLPGRARRYSQLPDNACLVSTSDEAGARVIDALAGLRLSPRPLSDYLT